MRNVITASTLAALALLGGCHQAPLTEAKVRADYKRLIAEMQSPPSLKSVYPSFPGNKGLVYQLRMNQGDIVIVNQRPHALIVSFSGSGLSFEIVDGKCRNIEYEPVGCELLDARDWQYLFDKGVEYANRNGAHFQLINP